MTRHHRPTRLLPVSLLVLAACGGGQPEPASGATAAASGGEAAPAASPAAGGEAAPAAGGTGGTAGSTGGTAGAGSGSGSGSAGTFQLNRSADAASAHGVHASAIRATATEAAMRLFVVDPETGPIAGIVIKLVGPSGQSFYTEETDAQGYAEVLVPVGQHYALEYLTLGRAATSAQVDVPEGPNQDIRLTLRYRRMHAAAPAAAPAGTTATSPTPPAAAPEPERLVLEGVLFATDSAALDPSSGPRLDRVVEYLVHHPRARVRIGGHTDNVGNPRHNRELSQARADAVRAYLLAHGVDASRVEAVGFGDSQPVATNDTPDGRARNRRIEATEIP